MCISTLCVYYMVWLVRKRRMTYVYVDLFMLCV